MTTESARDPPMTRAALAAERVLDKAELITLRARVAATDKANAARLAVEMDEANPDRDYQLIAEACYRTDVDGKLAHHWFRRGLIYGHYIDGTRHPKLCVNDLRAKKNKTGRHG